MPAVEDTFESYVVKLTNSSLSQYVVRMEIIAFLNWGTDISQSVLKNTPPLATLNHSKCQRSMNSDTACVDLNFSFVYLHPHTNLLRLAAEK